MSGCAAVAEDSGRSIGVAPSTAMLRHEVKVAGALIEKSGGRTTGAGLFGLVRGERPRRAGAPRGEGEPCIVAVEKEGRKERLSLVHSPPKTRPALCKPRAFRVGTTPFADLECLADLAAASSSPT